MIKINKVGIENIDRLSEIDINNFEDSWTKELFEKELLLPQAEYYGLFNDDEIIGFCGGWYVADEYQINKVVIDKPHRDKKLGQIFMAYILQTYKMKGAKKAIAEVRISNEPAIKVYNKSGMEIEAQRQNYYKNNGEDAYVMIRNYENE